MRREKKLLETINAFTGDYDFLANSYTCDMEVDGIKYTNAESAFWAQRVKDLKARNKYARLSGNKARAKALQAVPVDNWETDKDLYMMKILSIKFSNPTLKKKLLSTKGKKLLNNNTYRDNYWGIYYGEGENVLGQLLEKIRDNLH